VGREKRRKALAASVRQGYNPRTIPSFAFRFPLVKPPSGGTPHYCNYPSSQAHHRSPLSLIGNIKMYKYIKLF
jgi:hypothetical protein